LHMKGITVYCLTLDKDGGRYMKNIFGIRNYMIVDNALSLPAQLARALAQISAR
jgi:nitric oxide reductase activation protein